MSPLRLGIMWMCACGIVWPAAAPSFTPMLKPSGVYFVFSSWRTFATRDHVCDSSSSGDSKSSSTWRLGTIRSGPPKWGIHQEQPQPHRFPPKFAPSAGYRMGMKC